MIRNIQNFVYCLTYNNKTKQNNIHIKLNIGGNCNQFQANCPLFALSIEKLIGKDSKKNKKKVIYNAINFTFISSLAL